MARWLIHLKDGKTLTDEHCDLHDEEELLRQGYSPDDVTSVERIVNGRHLTIKKSEFIEWFWVGSEESVDLNIAGASSSASPPIVTKRIIGCYIKGVEPPLQARLTMDPRTYNVDLEFIRVKEKTRPGINATPLKSVKGSLKSLFQKNLVESSYSIVQNDEVDKVYNTPIGMACILKNAPVRSELIIMNQNVLLGFTKPGEILKIIQ